MTVSQTVNSKRVQDGLDRIAEKMPKVIAADLRRNGWTLEQAQSMGLYRFAENGGDGERIEARIREEMAK